MPDPRTYDEAMRRPSRRIWSGCGDGRCMPCGRIHDYYWTDSTGKTVHDFRCWHNNNFGCPDPHPEPEHDWNLAGRCNVCGVKQKKVHP